MAGEEEVGCMVHEQGHPAGSRQTWLFPPPIGRVRQDKVNVIRGSMNKQVIAEATQSSPPMDEIDGCVD